MIKIYTYSAAGEYLGTALAAENPLEPGKHLIPANSTTIEPPPAGMNEVAVFDGNAWSLQPDFRGRGFYRTSDGYLVKITERGELPTGLTAIAPGSFDIWDGDRWVFDPAKALVAIRAKRAALLAATDWTQVSDSALTEAQCAEWRQYRQALRDLPSTCNPAAPVWPVPPEEILF